MKHLFLSALAVVALITNPIAHAAGYLRLPDIPGESQSSGHEGWIVIESLSEAISQRETSGSGRTRGGAISEGIVLTKTIDRASPLLRRAIAAGQSFDEVVIEFPGASNRSPVTRYTLQNVVITSLEAELSSSGSQERVTLQYEAIEWEAGNVDASWNVQANTTSAAPRSARPARLREN